MSLFIRVQTSFWTHRKTMRLRARLGDVALWLPPRLWSYAAENQPDGDFTKYSAEELAMLVGCSTDAQAMLQALQDSGFMDGMKIHDWHEHNGYHEKFAERAKKAAAARWKGQEKKVQDKKGQDKSQAMLGDAKSNATSIPTEKKAGYAIPECFAGVDGFGDALQGWIDSRKQLRKPATDHAVQLMLGKLSQKPGKAIAALNKCILSGWQGFEWAWMDGDRNNGATLSPFDTQGGKRLMQ